MTATAPTVSEPQRVLVYRHSLLVRITHWINVVCIIFLVMSGLQIFNAHPALYIGQQSNFDDPILKMRAVVGEDGQPKGVTTVFGIPFTTTGVLGLSSGPQGQPQARGFPRWLTVPSYQDLATGRRWHFFFVWIFVINGLVYLIASLADRHVWRDLLPSWDQVRGIGRSILDHIRLRFDHGRDYNVLQKLAYLGIIFVVLPLHLPDRADHVAGHGCGVPLAPRRFRRTADGADDPLHLRLADRPLRARPRDHGADLGRLEQPAFDDYRPLRGHGGKSWPVMR